LPHVEILTHCVGAELALKIHRLVSLVRVAIQARVNVYASPCKDNKVSLIN
jgi:hypothetical protein